MFTKEYIEKLFRGCRDDSEKASLLEWTIREHEQVVRDIMQYHRLRQEEIERHQKEMKSIDNFLRTAQDKCPHVKTTRHYDPAGGSGSFTSCDLCNKEM